jgi:hypothetical protein
MKLNTLCTADGNKKKIYSFTKTSNVVKGINNNTTLQYRTTPHTNTEQHHNPIQNNNTPEYRKTPHPNTEQQHNPIQNNTTHH